MIVKDSKLSLIVVSLIWVILLALAIFMVYDIKVKNQETSRLQSEADRITESRNVSQSIRIARDKVADDVADLDHLALSSDKLVFLIEGIEGAGRALGLDTNIISVGKEEDRKFPEPDIIRITIETQGTWASTLTFLRALESLPHRVMIDKSIFSKAGDDWYLKIVLSLNSFD